MTLRYAMTPIEIHRSFAPLTRSGLNKFMRRLQLVLPPRYQEFLLVHNGGMPTYPIHPMVYLQYFAGLTTRPSSMSLARLIASFRGRIPADAVPIALCNRDLLCVANTDDRVFLWIADDENDNPQWSDLTYVAADVFEVVAALKPSDPDDLPKPESKLFRIGYQGNVAALDAYLAQGGDINEIDEQRSSIVSGAVTADNIPFLKKCIARGAELHGRELLHATVLLLDQRVVKFLLDAGVDPNERDSTGRTPLDHVFFTMKAPAIDLIREAGGRKSE